MKQSIEAGAKFRTEATDHLVLAHGCYRGAFRTSNFQVGGAYVDSHTIDNALIDALSRYGVEGLLCVGAEGRACGTCRRLLGHDFRTGTEDYRGKTYLRIASKPEFTGLCCDRDPENSGRPFPSRV
jgi:hypothetical protein